MDELARSVVADTLDSEVRATEPAPTGNSKRTVFATLADGRELVVQHATGEELATETALWEAVTDRTDVPVPRILAAGVTTHPGTGERRSYVVCERVGGLDLHTAFADLAPPDRHAVARTLGSYLGELHAAFPFEGYGEVRATDGRLRVTDPIADWRTWFGEYLQAGLADFGPELADLAPEVRAAVDIDSLPERPPAHLFPWDFRPGNAMLDEATGEVAALLDWGAPLAADPALSLAKAEYLTADWYAREGDRREPSERTSSAELRSADRSSGRSPREDGEAASPDAATADRLREAFREGYATHRPVPDVPRAYRLAAVVRSAHDSNGEVTRPGYPERTGEDAVAFHREQFRRVLAEPAAPERPGE